ncbi:MAG: GTP cyclohydrolase II [Hyphomicrobium sp.]|jgi:GTP cyclohydrolase II/3,4-dihydroxy 2-butanone 4-phosphate synthase/GTP cyclohydrolase II
MPPGAKPAKLDVARLARTILPIEFKGQELQLEARAYQGKEEQTQAMALINRGEGTSASETPVVRVHSGCVTGDIFHSLRCDCHAQLEAALERISSTPNGVLIYLPYQEGRGIGLFNKIKAYALQDQGLDTVDANIELGEPIDAREYELAAEILHDLGFPKIRLMTNNPAKVEALVAEGIEVIERIPLVVTASAHNKRYLETKRNRMSHEF